MSRALIIDRGIVRAQDETSITGPSCNDNIGQLPISDVDTCCPSSLP